MTPGTYLRKRREAFGRSIDEVALTIHGPGSVIDMPSRLEAAEADTQPLSGLLLGMVRRSGAFPFDPAVYFWLVAIARGDDQRWPAPRICRSCACSEMDACDPPCAWVEPDLCTGCGKARS
jgi:hypothetical protein